MFLLLTGPQGQHELSKSDLHCFENWKTKGAQIRIWREELSERGQDETKKAVCRTAQPCSQALDYLEDKVSLLRQRGTLRAMSQEFCLHVPLLDLNFVNIRGLSLFSFSEQVSAS